MNKKIKKLQFALNAAVSLPAALTLIASPTAQATNYNAVASGNWQDGTKWSPASAPNASTDTATINGSTTGFAITYDSTNTRTVSSVSLGNAVGSNVFSMTGGSLTLTATTGVNVANKSGNKADLSGGTLTLSGTYNNAQTTNISGASVNVGTTYNNTTTGITTISQGALNAKVINNSNQFSVSGTGSVITTSSFTNNLAVSISGGSLDGGSFINNATATATISGGTLTNSGASGKNTGFITLSGSGTFKNTGTFAETRTLKGGTITNAGTLNVTAGTFGDTGTTINQQSGKLDISSGASNSVGTLNITGGSVNLTNAGDKISVNSDYTNNFGNGNNFKAFANVTGSGSIVAAGDAKQGISLNGGAASNASTVTMDFGKVHVGTINNQSYQIANTGSTGPSIRGAIQGGGLTSDLSGTGISAADTNYAPNTGAGALATKSSTAAYGVTFAPTAGGALTSQNLTVVDNFGDKQTLSITGTAYNYATASITPSPVTLDSVHVGDSFGTKALSVNNAAPSGVFSEGLIASFGKGSTTGSASNNGVASTGLIAAGSTDSTSLVVGLGGNAHTGSAGAVSGTTTVSLISDGTGTSGLGQTFLQSQTINVSGNVYNYADAALANATGASLSSNAPATYTLNFGNHAPGEGGGKVSAHLDVQNIGGSKDFTDYLFGNWSTKSGSGFSFNPSAFSDIAGGDFSIFNVFLDTTVLGTWNEQIIFTWNGHNSNFSGGANNPWIGTSDGQNTTKEIILNLTGAVIPEPGILWLYGSASVGAWLLRRREKGNATTAA